jgi:hypothetical protein
VLEAYLAFLILFGIFAHGVAPGLLREAGKLLEEIPGLLDSGSTGETVKQLGQLWMDRCTKGSLDLTPSHWIWMTVLWGIWRLIQDYYTSPQVIAERNSRVIHR